MEPRPFQFVVWGANGYTGKLLCEQIVTRYPGKFRWAMAGRNKQKLEALKTELEKIERSSRDVPLIIADAEDQASIDAMVGKTDVIIGCAGPFELCGGGVVDASVRLGTHYCDVTGETPWVYEMIRKHHDAAKEKGLKIVHCCGMDSVPSDLGVWFVVDHMKKKLGKKCARAQVVIIRARTQISGGTTATGMRLLQTRTKERLRILKDPYSLDPPESRRGNDGPDQVFPRYEKELGAWTGPSIMAAVNTRIVRRSNALFAHSYGDDFRHGESTKMSGLFQAFMSTFQLMSLFLLLQSKWVQWLFSSWIPKPGEGASKEEREAGYWEFRVVGITQEEHGVKPKVVQATVEDPHDGYTSTATTALESALCLALQQEDLKKAGTLGGGVLTPTTAMGPVLIDRLQKAGIKFEILDA